MDGIWPLEIDACYYRENVMNNEADIAKILSKGLLHHCMAVAVNCPWSAPA
ncbi:MAG: hypothetical protein R3E63_07440 [Pseudomonadales bacterium]